MDNPHNRNRQEGGHDFNRRQYERQIAQERREGASRNDRAEKQSQDFSNYINLIRYGIGRINNDNVRNEFTIRLRALSEKYPAMFTAARERYPQLFGGQGPDSDIGQLGP